MEPGAMHSNKTLQLLAADQVLFHVEGKPDQAAVQPFLQKSCYLSCN